MIIRVSLDGAIQSRLRGIEPRDRCPQLGRRDAADRGQHPERLWLDGTSAHRGDGAFHGLPFVANAVALELALEIALEHPTPRCTGRVRGRRARADHSGLQDAKRLQLRLREAERTLFVIELLLE